MTQQEYDLMIFLIEKAKSAANEAVKDYAPKDAPYVSVVDFDANEIHMQGDEGYPSSDFHLVYLPVSKIISK